MIADIVLLLHFFVVLFICVGFFLIPIGYTYHWRFVKNKMLRGLHLALMALVTLETLLGINCPLTLIENSLRGVRQSESFIGYWIGKVIYWDLPPQFFLISYFLALGWILLMWKLFPISYDHKADS